MARVKDDLINLRGTLGNLIFYQRNGCTYVRTKPASYRDAKTEKQLLARGRFAGCNRFYDMLQIPVFRQIWKIAAKGTGKNPKNVFMQHNLYAFGKEKLVNDYSRLQFSTGLLPLPDKLRITRSNMHDCLMQWEYDSHDGVGSNDDRLYIVEIKRGHQPYIHETGICRKERKINFSSINEISGELFLYCFWGNEQETAFSVTHYFSDLPLE